MRLTPRLLAQVVDARGITRWWRRMRAAEQAPAAEGIRMRGELMQEAPDLMQAYILEGRRG